MSNGSKIQSFYQNDYAENIRLERRSLEFIRSKEIISRYLTEKPMEIADIGGAAGVYSYWLTSLGHKAHLLDFTPLHIEQAKEYGEKNNVELASYHCGDACNLPYSDNSFDMVLLMGPLYHLQERNDRLRCISEAKRVLKPGGVLMCALISRYAAILDGFKEPLLSSGDENKFEIINKVLETGVFSPGDMALFTSAYFHKPSDIQKELKESGFEQVELIAIEGFARAVNTEEILKNENHRELLLEYIRKTESRPEIMGMSDHFFAITRK